MFYEYRANTRLFIATPHGALSSARRAGAGVRADSVSAAVVHAAAGGVYSRCAADDRAECDADAGGHACSVSFQDANCNKFASKYILTGGDNLMDTDSFRSRNTHIYGDIYAHTNGKPYPVFHRNADAAHVDSNARYYAITDANGNLVERTYANPSLYADELFENAASPTSDDGGNAE